MKPARVALSLAVACLGGSWTVGTAEAAFITVEAVLDHLDLSDTDPIIWSVQFQPVLTHIDSVRLDWTLVGDGIDSNEAMGFGGVIRNGSDCCGIGGGGMFSGTLIAAPYNGPYDHFLDGSAQGKITIEARTPGFPSISTATFDRLIFTFDDGVPVPPAPTPEPGSLLLLGTGLLAGARRLRRRGSPAGLSPPTGGSHAWEVRK